MSVVEMWFYLACVELLWKQRRGERRDHFTVVIAAQRVVRNPTNACSFEEWLARHS